MFKIKVLPPGKGFRTLFDSDLDSDNECTVTSTTIKHHSKDVGRELDAEISLIIGRKNNEKIDVLHSYLNGIKRRMLVDSGAATSVIHNTEYPRKSRLFKIESVDKNHLYDWYDSSDIFWSDEEGEHDDNDVYKNYGVNNNITTKVVPDNQECKDPPMDGLELWFSSQDFRTEFDIVEDIIHDSNIRIELVFSIKVLPPGKGFRTLFDSDLESDSECTVMSTTIMHYSKDVGKELDAKISLVIGRKDNGKIDVLHSYLNGIKRRMLVDSGAATSVIHNTEYPRKSRLFKIESVEKNYLYNWYDSLDIFRSDEEEEYDDNDDTDGKFEEVKKEKEDLKEDSLEKKGKLCSDSFRKDEATLIHEKEEGNMENI